MSGRVWGCGSVLFRREEGHREEEEEEFAALLVGEGETIQGGQGVMGVGGRAGRARLEEEQSSLSSSAGVA